uniref:Uncharacterized protein n=1 Tax=Trichuris muris TaxID=70415 RepID=A0A5S6Q6J2_TRIMR
MSPFDERRLVNSTENSGQLVIQHKLVNVWLHLIYLYESMAINIDEYNSCPTRTRHIWKRLHAQVKNLLKSIGRIWLLEIAWERKVRVSIEIMECVFDSLQALQNVWHAIEYQQMFDNSDTLSTRCSK